MNLSQAYQGWQQMQENRELYKNTREAFRKAWFTLPTNKPCSYYTKEVLGTALAETRVIESDKAKAASVMVHVLTFAHWAEPKFNPEPDFEYGDLMEYTKGPLADPSRIAPKPEGTTTEPPQESSDALKVREFMSVHEMDIKRIETNTVPEPCDEHGNALPADEPTVRVKPEALARRKAELKARKSETKTKKNMDEKKTRGKQSRKICQIDAETLQVIKTYDSCSEGCRAAGVKNIDRAIKRLQLAGGYYWQYPEDVATFADRLAAKRTASKQAKPKVQSAKPKTQVEHKPSPSTGDAQYVLNDNQRGTAAHEALEVFTDDELLEELDRRGWQGELRKVQIVTIGTGNESPSTGATGRQRP